jgi:hypothetical protein
MDPSEICISKLVNSVKGIIDAKEVPNANNGKECYTNMEI